MSVGRHDLVVGVEIAAVLLGLLDQADDFVGHPLGIGVEPALRVVGDGLEPLVHVRVHEHRTSKRALKCSGRESQIVQVAPLVEHAIAVRQARRADDGLAGAPEAVVQAHLVQGQPAQARVRTGVAH